MKIGWSTIRTGRCSAAVSEGIRTGVILVLEGTNGDRRSDDGCIECAQRRSKAVPIPTDLLLGCDSESDS